MIAKNPLSAEEHERIAARVAAVEAQSSSAFALAIVPVSDRYRLYPTLWAAFAAILALGAAALARPDLSIGTGFLVTASLFLVLTVALEWPPLRLAIVPKRVKHKRASEFAHRDFAARILAAEPRRVGLLFFVSLGERYVEIVTDREIDARIDQAVWDNIVADFTATVKAGRLAEGLIAAVDACGAVLRTHYG